MSFGLLGAESQLSRLFSGWRKGGAVVSIRAFHPYRIMYGLLYR